LIIIKLNKKNIIKYLVTDLNDFHESFDKKKDGELDIKEIHKTQNGTSLKLGEISQVKNILNKEINDEINEKFKEICTKVKNETEFTKLTSTVDESSNYLKLLEIDGTDNYVSDITLKLKKGKFDDNQFDSFQDAFIKTLQIDSSLRKNDVSEIPKLVTKKIEVSDTRKVSLSETTTVPSLSTNSINTNFSNLDNFDNLEIEDNTKIDEKSEENILVTNYSNIIQPLNNSTLNINNKNLITDISHSTTNEDKKRKDNSTNSISTSISVLNVNVPVKKREKPRIIENVALKEPMILKTKLTDKHIGNIGKHKLDDNKIVTDELKNVSKAKLMKMETVISNSKNKLHTMNDNLNHTTNKIKSLKSEDSSLISSITDIGNEQLNSALTQTVSEMPCSEKYIQQSSQSLVEMDLDINSMPFVLSEDVLTPESIEQMPVVISSILPAKIPITTISTTLITPSKEIFSTNKSFESVKDINEIFPKKKSGTPAILKNKNKVKPTITSIKTIVPPLTSAMYKGNFKLNTQALKTSLSNPKTPGKYVIVQTSGHQQAYSTYPKVSIPTSKGPANAQIVQQGSKVVILTSPQSGQSGQKVLPLNSISKVLKSGKIQRIITSKQDQQMYTSVSSQNFVNSKNNLPSSSDLNSSTSSRITSQKILGQQVTSKSVLTQLPGTITKSTVLGTLPQGILIKEGVFTPINTSTLGGKTIISSKTLVTKGFSHQSIINTSKNTLNQPLSNKTIINSQGIVSKGTILTPITGSQVKAFAAKNIKGNKLQYQLDQYKMQLGGAQKSLNVPISSSFVQGSANLKTSSNVMVLQKTDIKTIKPSKKLIKQTVQKQISEISTLLPSTIKTLHQKSKESADPEQKNISLKNIEPSIKLQQKVVEKPEEIVMFNSIINEISPIKTKNVEQKHKTTAQISKSNKNINRIFHKKISNLTNSVALSSSNTSASFSLTIPPLETINYDKIPKKEEIFEQISSKKEPETSSLHIERTLESSINVQSQIMALPTENSDGTQAYVLVTVDEQGHIVPLDNSTLMSLEGTSNLDGNKTLYIDSSSLIDSGNINNIVLQVNNASLSHSCTTNILNPVSTSSMETLPPSQNVQTTNQDILAVALANTDFQHEIGIVECSPSTTITNHTQTSLINQTILQSTIIPPTEPISSPLVLETSLTLNQPIMTPLEIPSSVSIQSDIAPAVSIPITPTSLELSITEKNQNVSSYTAAVKSLLQIPEKPILHIEKSKEITALKDIVDIKISSNVQCKTKADLLCSVIDNNSKTESKTIPDSLYSFSAVQYDKKHISATPSMPILDDTFNANNGFDSTNTSVITENNLENYITKTSEELIQDLTGNDSLQVRQNL
jgi:hypothetical protein